MMKRSLKKFTLIELMISLLILSILMIAIWQVVSGAIESRRYVREEFEPTKAGSAILNLMLKELKYSHYFYITDLPLTEEEAKRYSQKRSSNENNQRLMLFNAEEQEISNVMGGRLEFYTASPMYDPRKWGIPEVSKVVYYLQAYSMNDTVVSDRVALMRSSAEAVLDHRGVNEATVKTASSEIIGFPLFKGIRLMKIQYYNGTEWSEFWTGGKEANLPLAVRIDLVINASPFVDDAELPPISYSDFDSDFELYPGDVRFKGMTPLVNSQRVLDKATDRINNK